MSIQLPYKANHADDCYTVHATQMELGAIAVDIEDHTSVPEGAIYRVNLASIAEFEQLLKELDDPSGDAMWKADAICMKYSELASLRP